MARLRPLLAAILMVIALFAAGMYLTGGLDPLMPSGSGSANGPDQRRIARVATKFQKFAESHALAEASLAIGFDGAIVHGEGIGGRLPDTPVPVASLSKAITAICLAELFRTRDLPLSTTLADLSQRLSTVRVTPPSHARDLSVQELLSQTSGLDPDITQDNMLGAVHGTSAPHRRIAFLALSRNAMRGVRGQFYYNNGNYAVLGAVIEAVSGGDYVPVCTRTVLLPAGATGAHMQGRLAALSSFGGWDVSAEDYTRFLMRWYAPEQPWFASSEDLPRGRDAPEIIYEMGMRRREVRGGPVYSHIGIICTGRAEDATGAIAIALPGSYAITATWNACVDVDTIQDFISDLIATVQ